LAGGSLADRMADPLSGGPAAFSSVVLTRGEYRRSVRGRQETRRPTDNYRKEAMEFWAHARSSFSPRPIAALPREIVRPSSSRRGDRASSDECRAHPLSARIASRARPGWKPLRAARSGAGGGAEAPREVATPVSPAAP